MVSIERLFQCGDDDGGEAGFGGGSRWRERFDRFSQRGGRTAGPSGNVGETKSRVDDPKPGQGHSRFLIDAMPAIGGGRLVGRR